MTLLPALDLSLTDVAAQLGVTRADQNQTRQAQRNDGLNRRRSGLGSLRGSVVSGQKSNKFNWLAVGGGSDLDRSGRKAHETSVFSKTDTDKICRHV